MSSNRMPRSMSLDNGVTPRRLNQVVLPDPGNPIVSTTYPFGDLDACSSAGGWLRDSGCVSSTNFGSSSEEAAPSWLSGLLPLLLSERPPRRFLHCLPDGFS